MVGSFPASDACWSNATIATKTHSEKSISARIGSGDAPSRLARILSYLAAGEMAADKLPAIPARTDALPLFGRIVSGAMVGASVCGRRQRVACVLTGAAGALVAAYALTAGRRVAARRRIPNAVAGTFEDVLALVAGLWLMRRV
ncbi:MAG TPA: DUF4126 family protein [Vicinamibacterales bacterium]|nr:DUF4126 family protein [Vicinamibacterales bacterium]